MDKPQDIKIVALVVTILIGIVFYIFAYEFWFDRVIQFGLESLIDLSLCQGSYPEPFDTEKCQVQIDKYTMTDSLISRTIKSISFFFLAYYCSLFIVGNKYLLGFEFLFKNILGIAAIVVPFTIADVTVWSDSFMNMLPIGLGYSYFVFRNRKIHNNQLKTI